MQPKNYLLRLNLFDLIDWYSDMYTLLSDLISQEDLVYVIFVGMLNTDLTKNPDNFKDLIMLVFTRKLKKRLPDDFSEVEFSEYILNIVKRLLLNFHRRPRPTDFFETVIIGDVVYLNLRSRYSFKPTLLH